jgi:hypothetical protein
VLQSYKPFSFLLTDVILGGIGVPIGAPVVSSTSGLPSILPYVRRRDSITDPQGPTEPKEGLTLGAIYLVEPEPMNEAGKSGVAAHGIEEGSDFDPLQDG